MAAIDRWLEYAAFGVELLAVVLIAGHVLAGTARYLWSVSEGRLADSRADYEPRVAQKSRAQSEVAAPTPSVLALRAAGGGLPQIARRSGLRGRKAMQR